MTRVGLLKVKGQAGDARVQPFFNTVAAVPYEDVSLVEAPASAEAVMLAELTERLEAREAEVASHGHALEEAYKKGEAEGRLAAEEEFEDSRAEALSLLETALVSAREKLADGFSNFETLSLLVATEAVDKLCGDAAHCRDLLVRSIGARVAELRAETILTILVSREDFPNTNEITELRDMLGSRNELLSVSDDLGAGECSITLELGKVELSLRRHWDEMKEMLASVPKGEPQE